MSPGFRLIVTEKPSVARDIARVLKIGGGARGGSIGSGPVRVTWCLGHLVELVEPQEYDPAWKAWRLEALPMLPERFKLRPRSSGRDQWNVVRALLRDPALSDVVNACDAGREGELIFAYVYQLAGCKAPVQRLWISSMTDQAITAGFEALRPGPSMRDLEAAARCRAEADWLVGMNATRAMTVRLRQGARGALYSLGRVQTPTLALLDERERAIEEFTPEPFWQLWVTFERDAPNAGETWEAVWTAKGGAASTEAAKGREPDRIVDRKTADEILARTRGRDGVVSKVERKKTRERPPLLYDLTSLQKEANRRFKHSAQHTLDLAQELYEKHKLLTYPRTDSRHLGSDQVPALPGLIESLRFGPYQAVADELLAAWPSRPPPGPRVVDDAEVSDHHAIIPTGVDARKCGLSPEEKHIFDLVARRFLAVFMPDAVFAAAVIESKIGDDLFVARGRTLLEPGWQAIDPPASKRKEAADDDAKGEKAEKEPATLPAVEKGEAALNRSQRLQEGVTKPPPRYTEASLLGAMERAGEGLEVAELKRAMKRKGLGTPATRAAMIETLLSRGYVERQRNVLVPTAQGRALLRALPVEALRSPRLTGEWEARLAAVADGAETRAAFMADIARFVTEAVRDLSQIEVTPELARAASQAPAYHASAGGRSREPTASTGEPIGACPRCGGQVSPTARGWACGSCPLTIPATVARREVSERMARKLLEHGETAPVSGFKSKAGKEFRAALKLDAEGQVTFSFPQPEELGACPACHKPVRLRGGGEKRVYTCDSGRECPFVVPAVMQGLEIPEAAVRELLTAGRSPLLSGFVRARPDGDGHGPGARYDGVLEWTGSRVVVSRADHRPQAAAGPAGACPRCRAQVSFQAGRRAWCCDGGCGLQIPAIVARRELRREEVAALLAKGRTPRLHGFRQKKGTVFKAALVLDDKGELGFDFDKAHDVDAPPPPRSGPPPAFGERITCPICVSRAEPDPGYVVAGHEAWGCSRWRQGCALRVPFEIQGVRIPDDEAMRLFSSKKATRYLEAPMGQPGKRKTCRVVLRPGEEPCWAVEPRRPRSP